MDGSVWWQTNDDKKPATGKTEATRFRGQPEALVGALKMMVFPRWRPPGRITGVVAERRG